MGRTAALMLLVLACTACAARAGHEDAVDRFLASQLQRHHLPGMSVAIVQNGRVVKACGYGTAQLELGVPATPDTVYEIGSMTKQFTAAAVLMLAREGRLGLDDSVCRWLPEAPASWQPITLRHLLTHTAGIQNHVAVPGYMARFRTNLEGDTAPPRAELLRQFAELPLEFAPGTSWAYDNTGYHLLGTVVERASGVDYFEFLRQRVFAPLGMAATGSTAPRPLVPGRAAGYEWTGNGFENRPALLPPIGFAAGALHSTVLDLARWDAALRGDQILDATSRASMWTAARNTDGTLAPQDYGFGWFVDTWHGHRIVQHNGGTPGFSAVICRFLDDQLTVILLTNHGDHLLDQLALDVAGVWDPNLARPVAAPDPDPSLTARMHQVVTGLLDGHPDPAWFTPSMAVFLTTATGRGLWPWSASHGPVTGFRFAEQEDSADGPVLRYRLELGGNPYWCAVRLDRADRVAQVRCW